MTEQETIEGNKLIAEFEDLVFSEGGHCSYWMRNNLPEVELLYHSSWDWLHPVYIKITEIGIWMMTNNHEKLWLEKSKEIEYAMLNEETPQRAAILISQLIKWYNQNKEIKDNISIE